MHHCCISNNSTKNVNQNLTFKNKQNNHKNKTINKRILIFLKSKNKVRITDMKKKNKTPKLCNVVQNLKNLIFNLKNLLKYKLKESKKSNYLFRISTNKMIHKWKKYRNKILKIIKIMINWTRQFVKLIKMNNHKLSKFWNNLKKY